LSGCAATGRDEPCPYNFCARSSFYQTFSV
jgi:hypothetical protein